MVLTDAGTTTCPECGDRMPLVTYTGEKPVCAKCAGMTTTGVLNIDTNMKLDGMDFDESDCLHDALERSRLRK